MDIKVFRKEIKSNCISWYDFKEKSNILVVGEEVEELKECLVKKGHTVNSGSRFDYIVLKENLKELENLKEKLKPGGVVLLLISNKYGLANTGREDLFNKYEIERYLKKQNFIFNKFYYPLSNYEQANTIYSDDYLPDPEDSKLLNNVLYDDDSVIKYNELDAIKIATKAGKFIDYTNSYIVEIGNKSPIKFISFNNARKPEYRLVTKVYDDKVVKEPLNSKAVAHIEEMKKNGDALKKLGFNVIENYEDGKIVSNYIPGKSLYDEIVGLIRAGRINEAYKTLGNWYQAIDDICKNEKVVYIDLVPENTFFRDDKYLFFDQEWKMENIPLEFILYRTINNLYIYNPEVAGYVSKEEMLKQFDLKDIEKYKEYEAKFQNEISDMELAKTYDEEYKEKYKKTEPFEFYIIETFKEKLMKKLGI